MQLWLTIALSCVTLGGAAPRASTNTPPPRPSTDRAADARVVADRPAAGDAADLEIAHIATNTTTEPLRIGRGENAQAIAIPRDEQLFYEASINLGVLGHLAVGKVILSSGVDAYVAPLPAPGEPAPAASQGNAREVGWIHSLATGYYLGYRLVHNLDARILPQEWPSTFYRDTQSGTENRRSELKIGTRHGELQAQYLPDHHCFGCANQAHFVKSGFLWQKTEHCPKCKLAEHRVWGDPQTRTVPPGTVDLLSAVFLARTMVADGVPETTFPVVNEQKLWNLRVARGNKKRISSDAGDFDCVLIKLETSQPPGEPKDKFAGLFGIRGAIRIWMDERSGVPVEIQGDLPVPVIGKLEIDVTLTSYAGAPKEFAPAR
jgi:hypothetical protein